MADRQAKGDAPSPDATGETDAPAGVIDPDKASGGMSAGFPAKGSGESTSAAEPSDGGGT